MFNNLITTNYYQVENVCNYQSITSNSIIDKFLQNIDTTAIKTISSYRKNINRFVAYLEENKIFTPNKNDLNIWKQELIKKYKASTINAYISTIKSFFLFLANNLIYPNIASELKPIKQEQEFKKDPLSLEGAKTLIQATTNLRDKAIISLMLTTGLRTIELSRANVCDIQQLGKEKVLFIQGKGRTTKNEYVKLSSSTAAIINQYIEQERKANEDPLFTSTSNAAKGSRLTTDSISRIIRNYLMGSNLKTNRVTAHSLRHTAAVLNLKNGGTIEETQTLLRHKSSTTTRIYSHLIEREKNQSEQRIDNVLFN